MKQPLIRIDWALFLPALILTAIGLVTLYSLNISLFRSQLFAIFIAGTMFLIFSQVRVEILQVLTKPIYIISLMALFSILIIGIESRGAVRWLQVFGTTFQFSEICKPFLAVCLATFCATHTERSVKSFLEYFLFLSPLLLFIYLQPDLGNAIIYAAVAVIVSIVFGYPVLWYGLSLLPVLLVSPIFWAHLHEYQRQRIMTFIHPSKDVLGTSYNVIQAVIAVGSGMFWGKGLSQGSQSGLRFLPERHTDFMFATISEKFGYIGSIVLLFLFLSICVRIIMIYRDSDSTFAKIFSSVILLLLVIHMFFNIGMNIGLVPVVGITLPFVSYGGSSLLANFIGLGILSSISTTIRRREVLEIK